MEIVGWHLFCAIRKYLNIGCLYRNDVPRVLHCPFDAHVRRRDTNGSASGFRSVCKCHCLKRRLLSRDFGASDPTDLDAVRVLSASPAVLDLFMWLSYRCFSAKGEETIPLSGGMGLAAQLGNADYARPRKFREKLGDWLQVVKSMWPECPVKISPDGRSLLIRPAAALTARSA